MKTYNIVVLFFTVMLVMGGLTQGIDLNSVSHPISTDETACAGRSIRGDPVMIYDLAGLQDMNLNLSAHYILANDIDASETRTWNDGAGFEPIGNFYNRFTGSLDGGNFTITGLYIDRADDVGLFGFMTAAGEVSNVKLTNVDITGFRFVGGLIGWNQGSVENCYTNGSVTGDLSVGGLIGYNYMGSIKHSYSACQVVLTGTQSAGGLVGDNADGYISNSYATGDVTGDTYVGGLVGDNQGSTIENSYATGDVTGNQSIGGLVGRNTGTLNKTYSMGRPVGNEFVGGLVGLNEEGTVENSFWDVDTSGTTHSDGGEGKTTHAMMGQSTFPGWDFDIPGTWAMAGYPRLQWEHTTEITTVEELQLMRLDLHGNYTLLNDIDAYSTSMWNGGTGFYPVGRFAHSGIIQEPFAGSFNGNNHTIKGLYINDIQYISHVGMFGWIVESGVVKNVVLEDVYITREHLTIAGLVGQNDGTVENSHVTGYVRSGTHQVMVGGLVGWNHGTVSNSSADVTVNGEENIGGLVGDNRGKVSNSYATGTVSGGLFLGGLVGWNRHGTIENSYATASVNGDGDVGGLVGSVRAYSTVVNSFATGEVIGINVAGGLIGNINGPGISISNSYATGDVTGDMYVGGLIGISYAHILENCYATGLVNGTDYVGGLVGQNWGTVSNSFYDSETTGQSDTDKGIPKTTVEMMTRSTFTDAGWDFQEVWWMLEDEIYPQLQWFPQEFALHLHHEAESDGWNFVSFNLRLERGQPEAVLREIEGSYQRLLWYDASEGRWRSYVPGRSEHYNDLPTWNLTMGVWIKMNENVTFTVTGRVSPRTDITLYPGWNMVGFPSSKGGLARDLLPPEVSRIGLYDMEAEYNLVYANRDLFGWITLEPGYGYWVYNEAEHEVVWSVEY